MPARFDHEATLSFVETLSSDAMEGRAPGTAGSLAAQNLIVARMTDIGLQPAYAEFKREFIYGAIEDAEKGPGLRGVNVVGMIKGTGESDATIVVSAHYDHVGVRNGEIFNGADDNASGVGGMLAIAEHFAVDPPQHDTVFAAFDVEESHGFAGARDFIRKPPVAIEDIAFNLNLDMLARADNGLHWASGATHWPVLEPILEEVAKTAPADLRMGFDSGEGRDDWTLLSDQAVFFKAGIPHLFLSVEDHADYHTPRDDFERIDRVRYLAAIETAISVAEAADANLSAISEAAAGRAK